MRWVLAFGMLVALGIAPAAAQVRGAPRLEGTWHARLADTTYVVVIRPDSSVSLGDQIARWLLEGDSLLVALGDAWYSYVYRVEGERLVLSGGDLADPVILVRIGPATPRPDSVALPPAPPRERRSGP